MTVRPARVAGEADPNSVILRFEARKHGFTGPIRLVATGGTAPKVFRSESARLTDFEASTPYLWLTVVPSTAGRH